MANKNLMHYIKRREIDDSINGRLQRRLHVTEQFIDRLGLEKELEGHQGCVNCLEWNSEGRILASASDDFQVILWDPFHYKKIHTIETGHHGNIFSVKFLPKSNDNIVITGAGDFQIHVHDVALRETTQICSCPTGRVKRLATAPHVPFLFWSAAEDGVIRQFDVRCQHTCAGDVSNVLVYLRTHLGHFAEAKCLSINPCRPEILAVGANDPFVRLYDRRMIKLTGVKFRSASFMRAAGGDVHGRSRSGHTVSEMQEEVDVEDNLSAGCVQYFVAGHLPVRQQDLQKKYRSLPATYVTFGSDGVDLLVNLGGEQIYLFDTMRKVPPKSFDLPKYALPKEFGGSSSNGYSNGFSQMLSSSVSDLKKQTLPECIEHLKLTANMFFEGGEYSRAIRLYNEAIVRFPSCPLLYGNRAAAYMKRNWDGDMYAALRDCHTTLRLDPNHVKAFFRLARCLHELQWKEQAKECLEAFKIRFPNHASSHACRALDKDISSPPPQNNQNPPPNGTGTDGAQLRIGGKTVDLSPRVTSQEWAWREKAFDYDKRFYGHCNTTTDIKEANFFGSNGQYIMAGSDDGSIYFWERGSTNNVRILRGDNSIVNCLQPHPECCLLASSGIDPVVRLWSPQPEDGRVNDREVKDKDDAASMNQRRMKADPFDVVLMNMGYRPVDEAADDSGLRTYNCRTS